MRSLVHGAVSLATFKNEFIPLDTSALIGLWGLIHERVSSRVLYEIFYRPFVYTVHILPKRLVTFISFLLLWKRGLKVFVSSGQTWPSTHFEVVKLARLNGVFHTGAQLWWDERRRFIETCRLLEDQAREPYSLNLLWHLLSRNTHTSGFLFVRLNISNLIQL